jgi:hypothetical protein
MCLPPPPSTGQHIELDRTLLHASQRRTPKIHHRPLGTSRRRCHSPPHAATRHVPHPRGHRIQALAQVPTPLIGAAATTVTTTNGRGGKEGVEEEGGPIATTCCLHGQWPLSPHCSRWPCWLAAAHAATTTEREEEPLPLRTSPLLRVRDRGKYCCSSGCH